MRNTDRAGHQFSPRRVRHEKERNEKGVKSPSRWTQLCGMRWIRVSMKFEFSSRDGESEQPIHYRLHLPLGDCGWNVCLLCGFASPSGSDGRSLLTSNSFYFVIVFTGRPQLTSKGFSVLVEGIIILRSTWNRERILYGLLVIGNIWWLYKFQLSLRLLFDWQQWWWHNTL